MKQLLLFLVVVFLKANTAWAQCAPTVTISGNYTTTYTGSNSWIASSGSTTIPSGSNVTLDANPLTNGFVDLNPGFETQSNATFLAIVQTPCAAVPTTQIQSSQCGMALPTLTTTLLANWFTGAQEYRFRITQLDMMTNLPIGTPLFKDRPINNIALSNVPGIIYNAKYKIEIDVKLAGVWQNTYGPACTVTTPNPVSTIGLQCGTTLTAMSQWITATFVPNVAVYRFKITELDSSLFPVGTPKITDQMANKFNMTQLTGILYGTTYRVEVALQNTDGTFLQYNTACNISTQTHPITQLQQCSGLTASNGNQYIYCNVVSGATQYRFRLYDGITYTTPYSTTMNKFKLNNFIGLSPNTAYNVEIAVKMPTEPNFGPYGPICTINSSAVLRMIAPAVVEFKAVAYPNPFASSFLLDVKTASESKIQVRIFDMLGRIIEDKMLENAALSVLEIGTAYPSGVYNIIVTQDENYNSLRVIKK